MFFLQVMRVIQVIRMKMERWCPTMNPSPLSAGASQSQTFGRFFVSTPTKWKCTSTPGISPYLSTPYLTSPYSNSPYLTYLGWMVIFSMPVWFNEIRFLICSYFLFCSFRDTFDSKSTRRYKELFRVVTESIRQLCHSVNQVGKNSQKILNESELNT